jgi:outer membrane immunogenic protein
MKTALLAAIGAAAVTIASPALAQDEASSFNGPYVGVLGGYDNVGLNSSNEDGVLYGGVIGYDINLGGAVFGVEGEYSDSDTKFRTEDLLVTGDSARLKTGRDLYAGVRVGGPITLNVMLYAKGGYTNAKVKSVYDDGAGVSLSDSDELDGYRLGAGVEYARGPILGRLEYRYSSYGKYNSVDVERHQVAAVLGYRF